MNLVSNCGMEVLYTSTQNRYAQISKLRLKNDLLTMQNNIFAQQNYHISVIEPFLGIHIDELFLQDAQIIETPEKLRYTHIMNDNDDPVEFATNRRRYSGATTVFRNPEFFKYYPELGLTISCRPVNCYLVMPFRRCEKSIYLGKRWATFESGTAYHFDYNKWKQIPKFS